MQTAIGFLIVPAAPSLCNNCLTSVGLQKEEREGGRAKAKREEEKVVSRNEEHRGARSGLCYSTEEDDDLLAGLRGVTPHPRSATRHSKSIASESTGIQVQDENIPRPVQTTINHLYLTVNCCQLFDINPTMEIGVLMECR